MYGICFLVKQSQRVNGLGQDLDDSSEGLGEPLRVLERSGLETAQRVAGHF